MLYICEHVNNNESLQNFIKQSLHKQLFLLQKLITLNPNPEHKNTARKNAAK